MTDNTPTVLDEANARIAEARGSMPGGTRKLEFDLDLLERLAAHATTAAQEAETEAELQAAAIAKLAATVGPSIALRDAIRAQGRRGSMFGHEIITIVDLHPIDDEPLNTALGKLRRAERIETIQMLITDTEQTDADDWDNPDDKENQLSWLRGFLRAYTTPFTASGETK